MKGLKNNKAVGNDGIQSEVYKFASERLLTIMYSIFLSGCRLIGNLPSTLMHVVIIPLLKCKSKDSSDVTITGQLQLPQLSPRYLSRSCCRDWPGTCGLQTANLVSSKYVHGTDMAIFSLKQTVDFYRNQDTRVYVGFLDAKKVI